ncbi:MAG: hypothetical protein ACXWLM_09730 [Myxococcales bacterium]
MRTFLAIALLAAPLAAQTQQPDPNDWKKYNYYGDDQEKPADSPHPVPQPPRQVPPPQPQAQPQPPRGPMVQPVRRDDDWRYRVRPAIGQPPPPPRYEQQGGPHAAGQLWIPGFWMPRGPQHVWVPGHYATPPAPGYLWQPARWESANGAWAFYEGHWYPGEPPQAMIPYQPPPPSMEDEFTMQPPPPPVGEYQPPMPFGNAIWIPGYWHWNGMRFAWVAGRWSAHPPYYVWEPHRWVRSPDGRYREEQGHWRR